MRLALVVCALSCVHLLDASAQVPALSAESLPHMVATLEVEEVELGRPFVLRLVATHLVGTTVVWPEPLALGDGLEEQKRELLPIREDRDVLTSEALVTLMAFDTALARVPPIEMLYDDGKGSTQTRKSRALPLRVLSLVDLSRPVLRPARDPVDVRVRDWGLITIAAAILALMLLFCTLFFILRRSEPAAPRRVTREAPVLSPHEEALAKLYALEATGALDADDLKDAFLEMSEIFRAYLGRRYSFSALDLTSSEMRSRLASVEGNGKWLKSVNAWLSRCDLVKYANSLATPDEARESLYAARILIEETKEDAVQDRPKEQARG